LGLRELLTAPHRKSLPYYEPFYQTADLKIKSIRLRLAEHVAYMGDRRGAYGVLVRRPEGKRPLGRPRLRWEDNIKNTSLTSGIGRIGQD